MLTTRVVKMRCLLGLHMNIHESYEQHYHIIHRRKALDISSNESAKACSDKNLPGWPLVDSPGIVTLPVANGVLRSGCSFLLTHPSQNFREQHQAN